MFAVVGVLHELSSPCCQNSEPYILIFHPSGMNCDIWCEVRISLSLFFHQLFRQLFSDNYWGKNHPFAVIWDAIFMKCLCFLINLDLFSGFSVLFHWSFFLPLPICSASTFQCLVGSVLTDSFTLVLFQLFSLLFLRMYACMRARALGGFVKPQYAYHG